MFCKNVFSEVDFGRFFTNFDFILDYVLSHSVATLVQFFFKSHDMKPVKNKKNDLKL